jgi:hypothetical protein
MRIFIFTLFILTSTLAYSQTYLLSNNTDTTCSGLFYDTGGPSGNYGVNQNLVKTFVSGNGNRIKFTFNSFSLGDYDYMEIYDGPSTASPKISTHYYGNSPGIIEASGDALTFRFYSNYQTYNVGAGWEAQISCTSPVLQTILMNNQTDSVASQITFFDHEGGAANYAPYANYIHTFIAKNSPFLKVDFNMNALGIAAGDTLKIYDGNSSAAPLLGIYFSGSYIESRTASGNALTFAFSSDFNTQAAGWQAFITPTSTAAIPQTYNMSTGVRYVCNGIYRDHGGTGDYGPDQNMVQTFKSYSGNRIKFSFTMFSLSDYDYMEIYDGPSTASPKISTHYYGNSPGIIEASGDALTFRFYSNYQTYNVGAGWEAQISCTSPVLQTILMNNQTDSVASQITFFDHEGGAANYAPYANYIHTFIAKNSPFLKVDFNMNALGIAAGDTLKIYDGKGISNQLIGVYISGSIIESITSTSTALTFEFTSNNITQSIGWQAFISETLQISSPIIFNMSSGTRYSCDGIFRDHGGAGDYGNDINQTQTFIAKSGNRLKVIFSSFQTANTSDYLRIYNGKSTSSALIGTYSGSISPGTVIASDSALTFVFYSNYTGISAGWNAQFSCINVAPPAIISQPISQQVCAGDTAIFEIEAVGGDTLEYEWKFNGVAIMNATSNKLIINQSDASKIGNYFCIVRNPYGIDSSNVVSLSLFNLPVVSLNISPVCFSNDTINLTGGSPIGGNYVGPYVTNNQFKIGSAGLGSHFITYNYTDNNGCKSSATNTITIRSLPTVSISNIADICNNGAPIILNHGIPSGGNYSGNGVNGNQFIPSIADSGSQAISYIFTDTNGCSSTAQTNIYVKAAPTTSLNLPSNICINGTDLPLTGGLPLGGNYFGTGVYMGEFIPLWAGVGPHQISYKYTSSNGCSDTAFANISVIDTPTVSLSFNQEYCKNSGIINLTAGQPSGGIYSGSYIASSNFNSNISPAGNYIISYTVSGANNCTSITFDTLKINPLPIVTIATISDKCDNVLSFVLNQGSPAGGIYSGNGINQGVFSPNIAGNGNHIITYNFIDNKGCSSSAQTSINVILSPVASLTTPNQTCINGSVLTLSGGLPSGGNYLGNGIIGNQFSPIIAGVGSHSIAYKFTSTNGCSDTAFSSINVLDSPFVALNFTNSYCSNDSAIVLAGGLPLGGAFSGQFLSSDTFFASQAGSGYHNINYSFTDSNNCTSTTFDSILIHLAPTVILSNLIDHCDNEQSFILSGGIPSGGYYSGIGVTNNVFNPSTAGIFEVIYNFTDSNYCSNSDSALIQINHATLAKIDSLPDLCANSPNQTLFALPLGGNWTGNGISGNIFNPAISGIGLKTIYYYATDSNQCLVSDSIQLNVFGIPSISLGADTSIGLTKDLAVDAGSGFLSYIWNNGNTNQTWQFDADSAGQGDHIIWIIVADNNNCSNSDTLKINVFDDTSLNNNSKIAFKIYPNPTKDKLQIVFKKNETGIIRIYSIDGKQLVELSYSNEDRLEINLSSLVNGIYFLEMSNSEQRFGIKIIKE